jgi:hypothetical protein
MKIPLSGQSIYPLNTIKDRIDEHDSAKSDPQMKRAPKARKRTATQVSDLNELINSAPERQDPNDNGGHWLCYFQRGIA